MINTYFVTHDPDMHERQSDGVELCVIPEFYKNKIYYYCNEYQVFWDDFFQIGNNDKFCSFELKGMIRPATLSEICEAGLCDQIDSVKQCYVGDDGVLKIKCIHIKI